eukprot:SAG31_NODE_2675_length_5267_cov_6.821594_4_plen_255_part_00
MRVQAMSVGFMAIAASTPVITGYLRTEFPMMQGSMEWALLFISAATGAVFGALGIRFSGPTNIISTALIGMYGALQTVASLGYSFTAGLGVQDNAEGKRGCTTNGCYATVVVFGVLLLLAVLNQFKFKEVPLVEVPEDATKFKRLSLRVYNVVFTLLQPLFVFNNTLEEFGNDLTPDQADQARLKAMESFYQVLSFAGTVSVLSFTISMLVSTVELFITGVYTRTGNMMKLGAEYAVFPQILIRCECLKEHSLD